MLKPQKAFLKTKHPWFHSAIPVTLHSLHTQQPSQLSADTKLQSKHCALQDSGWESLRSPDLHEGTEPSGGRVSMAISSNSLSKDPFENHWNPVHQ